MLSSQSRMTGHPYLTSQHILTSPARPYFGHPLTVPYSSSVPQRATQASPASQPAQPCRGIPGLWQVFLKLGPGLELSGGGLEMGWGWLHASTRTTCGVGSARVHGRRVETSITLQQAATAPTVASKTDLAVHGTAEAAEVFLALWLSSVYGHSAGLFRSLARQQGLR